MVVFLQNQFRIYQIGNINNITNISFLFYGCSSLKSKPDISKWNTNIINDISFLFYGCSSLKSIPDISKWNTNKCFNFFVIFANCILLLSLPNISSWSLIYCFSYKYGNFIDKNPYSKKPCCYICYMFYKFIYSQIALHQYSYPIFLNEKFLMLII